ncbi:MAG: phospholipid carrier-dependent glycosyltransferase [Anaerolineales bacterium]|nr:phospholipid carrier-dependent glycosyltransferase [Anaerolineales bacterium]
MNKKFNSLRSLFLLIFFALLGFFVVILAPQQLGSGPDSFAYVSAARSFADGNGLRSVTWDGGTEIMTHFPPLYSLMLSGLGLGTAPVLIAKWLNALAFAGSIFLIGLILRELTERMAVGLAGAFIFLTSETALNTHFNIWTEALFVFLLLLTVYYLGQYGQSTAKQWHRHGFLVLTATFAGLAVLTRYVGAAVIGITALVILIWAPLPWWKRVKDAVLFVILSSSPIFIWFVRNSLVADSVANRVLAYHAIQWLDIVDAVYSFGLWLLPGVKETFAAGIIFWILLVSAIVGKRPFRQSVSITFVWCILFVFGYLGFLVFSISFIDAHTPLNYRILFPVYVISIIILLAGFANLLPQIQKIPFVRLLPLAALLVYLILNVIAGQRMMRLFYKFGQGYTDVLWQDSELMTQTFLLAENATIYTNVPDAFYFAREEIASGVPIKVYATSMQKNTAFDDEVREMLDMMANHEAVLVYFNRIYRWYLPTEEELAQIAPLTVFFENEEGAIYIIP